MLKKLLILTLLLYCTAYINAQKVGLVLSGGGALGFAHIGVLKALEENHIPIDYITGTSAGALVGSMYAVGWSPNLIDSLVMTDKFQMMSSGQIEKKYDHYFRKEKPNPSWIEIKLTKDFSLSKIIPTNFNNPVLLDYESMVNFSPVSKMASYDFDSLFVPFRCVASDVASKSPIVFDSGHLNQAVRASMTYPGYLKPIKVNGRLMFDGGLYNNFPTDVMYEEFFPDIIIGVNFTDTTSPPDEDDVFSQLKTMILNRNPSSIICENGILIEPDEPISIFGFNEGDKAIEAGYRATMAVMDSIKMLIERRVTVEEVMLRRMQFYSNLKPMIIEDVIVSGVSENVASYIKKSLLQKDDELDLETLKKRYFRLIADTKLKFIYPLARYNPKSGKYILYLDSYAERPFSIKFGGVFSSKPINTGYMGIKYARLGKIGLETTGESYFGKYYGSAKANAKLDFNYKVPFSIEGFYTLNRFDYFRSFATFFEESKPSFIIENERYAGANLIVPVSYFGKAIIGYSSGLIENSYYQTNEFTPSDTTDLTVLRGHNLYIKYEQSSLNRKQFSNKGSILKFNASYFRGIENTTPGSTSILIFPSVDVSHEFLNLRFKGQKYFTTSKRLSFGVSLDASALFTEKFLDNYTASVIVSPNFQPTYESKAMFFEEYSTHFFAASGLQTVFSINSNIDLRAEGYLFKPFNNISKNKYNQPFYDLSQEKNIIENTFFIGSLSAVFHSPIGPLSASLNHYNGMEKPWSFLVSFGYIIHNDRFIK